MYKYDDYDHAIIQARVAQFADQTRRYLAGNLTDDEFRPLRLQNALYIQRHGPMLRLAVPYGLISAAQLRRFADIARRYDRGFGHFTTRHNLQLNWVKLAEVPKILADLAQDELHAIQTSGNCIRNVTTDISPVSPPTRSPIRARGPRSCASGRLSTRNLPTCHASSRSRFPVP